MNIFLLLFAGFMGAAIGSFLNVLIYRFGASSVRNSRSICLSCGDHIRMRDLVPIFSYVFLGGKCRSCKTKISSQYIAVEVGMTILGFLIFLSLPTVTPLLYSMTYIVYYVVMCALLVLIAVYDLRHKIIPDEFSFTFAVLAFIGLFVTPLTFQVPSLWDVLAGPILAALPAALFYFSKGKWMGLGDAKLFLGVGWMLGLTLGISAFMLSFWIGAIISVILLRIPKGQYNMSSQVPFAPFIIAATLFVFFTKLDVFGLSLFG